jgi:L-threonylcarbamoyladenylate synthase
VLAREQLEHACGQALLEPGELAGDAPRASGTLESHYAPRARVRLMDANALQTALDVLGADAAAIATYSRAILRTPSSGVLRRRMPDDAIETARQLFAVLRDFDSQGVQLIWIETPPDTPEWEGVRDRLRRASAS